MIDKLIKIFESAGIGGKYQTIIILGLLGTGVLVPVLSFLFKIVKQIVLVRNQRLLNKDLTPYFTKQDVERATKYFIPTRFQNVSPSEDEEPGRKYIASAQSELIPLFLKKAFRHDSDSNKYYLILADTGMGKTTFLINLYLQYKNQWKTLLHLTNSREIVLFPLGNPESLKEIEKLPNPKNTILLLDAFDEDVMALDHHKERMNELLAKIQNFREIVITCRTQFFPSEEEEPYKTGYYSFGETGRYNFQKLYLSVFDDDDVKSYLRKRFSIFSLRKHHRAKKIVEKCRNLVVRPMLLSRINDLLDSDRQFDYAFQIYEVLISKWIERESRKRGIEEKFGSGDRYQKILLSFSQALALDLYKNKTKRGGYLIGREEKLSEQSALQIGDLENEVHTLSEREARSQSLLNRNSNGKYKFAHKSFLEYFLAKEMFVNPEFYAGFNFDGMSAARTFLQEMLISSISSLNGIFSTPKGRGQARRDLAEVFSALDSTYEGAPRPISELRSVEEIPAVIGIELKQLPQFDPILFLEVPNLIRLQIADGVKLELLYNINAALWWADQEVWRQLGRWSAFEFSHTRGVAAESALREIGQIKELLATYGLDEIMDRLNRYTSISFRYLTDMRKVVLPDWMHPENALDDEGIRLLELYRKWPGGPELRHWIKEKMTAFLMRPPSYIVNLQQGRSGGEIVISSLPIGADEYFTAQMRKHLPLSGLEFNRFLETMKIIRSKRPECTLIY